MPASGKRLRISDTRAWQAPAPVRRTNAEREQLRQRGGKSRFHRLACESCHRPAANLAAATASAVGGRESCFDWQRSVVFSVSIRCICCHNESGGWLGAGIMRSEAPVAFGGVRRGSSAFVGCLSSRLRASRLLPLDFHEQRQQTSADGT